MVPTVCDAVSVCHQWMPKVGQSYNCVAIVVVVVSMWCYCCLSSSFRVDIVASGSFEFGSDQFVAQVGVGSVRQSRCCSEESPEQWYVRVNGSPVSVYKDTLGVTCHTSYGVCLMVCVLWCVYSVCVMNEWPRQFCQTTRGEYVSRRGGISFCCCQVSHL